MERLTKLLMLLAIILFAACTDNNLEAAHVLSCSARQLKASAIDTQPTAAA